MKRILAIVIASVLFVITATIIWMKIDSNFERAADTAGKNLNYIGGLSKIDRPELLGEIVDEDTIVMLGSSELPYYNEKSHPMIVTNHGNSDFNIMQVGVGYIQSLSHAINISGLEPYMENKKVVLNLSPQWFTQAGVDPTAFSSRFSPRMFAAFMENEKVSNETKQQVIDRCYALFETWPAGKNLLERYEKEMKGENIGIIQNVSFSITDAFDNLKSKQDFVDAMPMEKAGDDKFISFETIDFDRLMLTSEEQGKRECTNNEFYIYDEYYTTYIEPQLEELEGSASNGSFSESPEYGDLKLFLNVCDELELEVMLINVPVNGYWYDYTGFPKEEREKYYENIREIAKEYGVKLLDLSNHEYTPYFLKDIMHLGWKGWVYIDEGIYEFYKESLSN